MKGLFKHPLRAIARVVTKTILNTCRKERKLETGFLAPHQLYPLQY
ncbi:MAG: hypothetical protein SAK29_24805 [Scytonema sp. PMC 1069.18]|nr:hypothetical protein [Scytonema sp. PMC 1069.18]MEC4882626.1 hypothetical protein [Scytonema sp. PMC 1070.18]